MAFHSYPEALDYIYSRNEAAIKLGLDNISALLALLGNPQQKQAFIHVAGTNGKGSVCFFISHILRLSGLSNIGLFTSPHLVSFRERISIDGRPLNPEWMQNWLNAKAKHIEHIGATYFETVTAMAADYFAGHACEASVFETGLGGRLDSTNVVLPRVSAITPVSRDHMQYLGETVEEIWAEKMAIIKTGVPCVINESRDNCLKAVESYAKQKESKIFNIKNLPRPRWSSAFPGRVSIQGLYGRYTFECSMLPQAFQRENLHQAVIVAECFLKQALWFGDCTMSIPGMYGRQQKLIHPSPITCIFDSAHNEASILHLMQSLPRLCDGKEPVLLFSLMSDKDIPAILKYAEKMAKQKFFVELPNQPRGLGWEQFQKHLKNASVWSNFPLNRSQVDYLMNNLNHHSHCLVVCGSFYLLGALIPYLVNYYDDLKYFCQFTHECVI